MTLYEEALRTFHELYTKALKVQVNEPTAMSLATVDKDGGPSVRIVLLKGVDERGFVFYTNYRSRKGQQIEARQHAALCFFWDALMEQVRVEGTVETVPDEEANLYWRTRSRESCIGAWASDQSKPLVSRDHLLNRIDELTVQFDGKDIPRPNHWSGFRVVPERIEFWHSGEHRVHDRVLYEVQDNNWVKSWLYP